jgi:Cytidine deaminase
MDIWEKLYLAAKPLYKPAELNDFVYANNVVCALESKSGKIYTGYCIEMACGTINLCAERVAPSEYVTRQWRNGSQTDYCV